jgi:hypothetical protein
MHPTRDRWRNLIPIALAFGLLRCASDPAPLSPLQIAGMRAKTIIVAPLNLVLALPDELKSSTTLVSEALVEHLEAHQKTLRVIDFRIGRKLWLESTRDVSEAGETRTFENAAAVFARKIDERIDFDALIIASLYVQNARIRSEIASWDGAKQKIEFIGRSRREIEMPPLATIPAASVLIHVLDPEGRVIHSKRTGLELIQHLSIHTEKKKGQDKRTWTLTDDDPALEDELRVRAAIAHSLSPFLSK